MGKRPGPGGPGTCEICQRERPHIYHVSHDMGKTWGYECPECSHLAAAEHLLMVTGFTGGTDRRTQHVIS